MSARQETAAVVIITVVAISLTDLSGTHGFLALLLVAAVAGVLATLLAIGFRGSRR